MLMIVYPKTFLFHHNYGAKYCLLAACITIICGMNCVALPKTISPTNADQPAAEREAAKQLGFSIRLTLPIDRSDHQSGKAVCQRGHGKGPGYKTSSRI